MKKLLWIPIANPITIDEERIIEQLVKEIISYNGYPWLDWPAPPDWPHRWPWRYWPFWPFWYRDPYPYYTEFLQWYTNRKESREELRKIISQSDAVIFSITKDWKKDSFIKDCIDLAFELKKQVIPVLIASATVPDEFKHLNCLNIRHNEDVYRLLRELGITLESMEKAKKALRPIPCFTLTTALAAILAFSFIFLTVVIIPDINTNVPTPTPIWEDIRIGEIRQGNLHSDGGDGWTFAASQGQTIRIAFVEITENILITVWSPDGKKLETVTEHIQGCGTNAVIIREIELVQDGAYGITVYQQNAANQNTSYSITILDSESTKTISLQTVSETPNPINTLNATNTIVAFTEIPITLVPTSAFSQILACVLATPNATPSSTFTPSDTQSDVSEPTLISTATAD